MTTRNAANKATRDNMRGSDHPKYVQDTAKGNTTITHALYTPPPGQGDTRVIRASSRQVMSQYDPSFVVGLSSDEKEELRVAGEKQKMNSAVCGGHVYKRGFFMPHSSHTEARILETIAANPPADTTNGFGKVVFGIDWPGGPNKGMSSKSPCPECQALICAALACFDIVVCDEENEPIDQSEECDE